MCDSIMSENVHIFFFSFIDSRKREREGETEGGEHRRERETLIGYLYRYPNQEPNLKLKHVS